MPSLGGGIADMVALTADGAKPVLRRWSGREEDGPFALGCNVLVPFSNRIFGGGFSFGNRFHPLEPNLDSHPNPIHGDGFLRPWRVVSADDTNLSMALDAGAIGDYRYRARQHLVLASGVLSVSLSIANTGPEALPFGCGFHPWFPRLSGTELRFVADEVWLEPAGEEPKTKVPVATRPEFDFTRGAPLPDDLIDHAFEGWRNGALIRQPDLGIGCLVSASPELATAIVYSPGPAAGFFCFEPVSHAVNAHNRPGFPGLRLLAPEEEFRVTMLLDWRHIGEQNHNQGEMP